MAIHRRLLLLILTITAGASEFQFTTVSRLGGSAADDLVSCRIQSDGTGVQAGKGVQMQRTWKYLRAGDKANLVTAAARKHNADDHAIAAFFAILAGNERAAAEHLDQAGEQADAVRAAFAGG
ncbi:MAG: hypothetical protein ACOCZK_08580 [Planctomycetota bacterium]